MSAIAPHLDGRTLILLSNREPYEHRRNDGGIEVRTPAGGLVSALDPTMRAMRGTWVAWGSGTADRESADTEGRLSVPPDEPSYTLRRVFLDDAEIDGFYLGFSNRSLWPLCHLLVQHIEYHAEHWERYRRVNRKFAATVTDEMARSKKTPVVWIHDYHFALAPEMIRSMSAPALLLHFWHIPFPPADLLRLLPVVPESVPAALLHGLLGNDLLAFQTERYALNFLGCLAEFVTEADIDAETFQVHFRGRTIEIGVFPISIDVARYETFARSGEGTALAEQLRARHTTNGRQLGVSVDRVDYTKGIPERLRALTQLWEQSPELCGRFTLMLVATPSRSELLAYRALEQELVQLVQAINSRFATTDWTPIVFVNENVSPAQLAGIYRAADLCLISSLQDGMNLVAKEFVASQIDERGVLVLSRFTGAAEEIDGAILIDPFNIDGFVDGIRRALEMSEGERRVRMHRMRSQLRERTIFDWLDAILTRGDQILAGRAAAGTRR